MTESQQPAAPVTESEIINHEEALQLAHMQRANFNLAQCYIEIVAEREALRAQAEARAEKAEQERDALGAELVQARGVLGSLDAEWAKMFPDGPETPDRAVVRIAPETKAIWREIRSVLNPRAQPPAEVAKPTEENPDA